MPRPKLSPFTCPRCLYYTERRDTMERHLNRITPCVGTVPVVLTEKIKAHILCNRVYDVARAEREAEKEAAKQEKLEREAKKAQLAEDAKAAKAAKKDAQEARIANRILKEILDAKEVRAAPEVLKDDGDAAKAHTQQSANNTAKAYKKIPNQVRIATWATHIGNQLDGICMCCEMAVITIADFHCAHVTAECLGGKATIDNLRPICSACNNGMRTRNLFEYKNSHFPSKKPCE